MWITLGLLVSSCIVLLLTYFYLKFKKSYRLWVNQKVPALKPTFPLGNLSTQILFMNFAHIVQKFYRKLKPSGDYAGLFFLDKPVLLVLSPEFAKTVLVKDFKYFQNRGVYFNKEDDPLSANLFFIENDRDEWRNLRNKISPTFSSAKIKQMFHTVYEVAVVLINHLEEKQMSSFDLEITEVLARFNTDVIGSCAFGMQCNTLAEPNSRFRAIGRKMMSFSRIQLYKLYGAMLFRKQARFLGFRLIQEDVSDFLINVCRKTINERIRNKIQRRDFMELMIKLYKDENSTSKESGLTLEEIAAQVFLFFFAGFETSSTAMTYALYELALHQDIQQRVREEINEAYSKHDNQFTYDGIQEMGYLEKVIFETMRKNPSVGTLHRVIGSDYTLPCGAVAPKGTYVIIPALAFHHDEEHFSNPDLFDPERFNDDIKSTRHPYAYLPFGEGPRICIGIKFGMIQTKLGLSMLLRQFRFEICSKTDIPLKVNNASLLVLPAGGVWLKLTQIE